MCTAIRGLYLLSGRAYGSRLVVDRRVCGGFLLSHGGILAMKNKDDWRGDFDPLFELFSLAFWGLILVFCWFVFRCVDLF